jgi:hypothetical protein
MVFHSIILIGHLLYPWLNLTAEFAENAEKILLESYRLRLNWQKRLNVKINAQHKVINPLEF